MLRRRGGKKVRHYLCISADSMKWHKPIGDKAAVIPDGFPLE